MLAAAAAGLAGCGVVTPNIEEPLDQDFPAVPGGPNERAPRITEPPKSSTKFANESSAT